MKSQSSKNTLRANVFILALATILSIGLTQTVAAKSLFVIADINGDPTPVHAYNIGADGTLTFQTEYRIPRFSIGAVGLAIDQENEYLFVTYEGSYVVQLIDAKTMTDRGTVAAPGSLNLAGIVYDQRKGLLYCVDRWTGTLYVYDWQPTTARLTPIQGSPFWLAGATAFGIALDEVNDLLYVANNNQNIAVYRTSDWSPVRSIFVRQVAISIALDVKNGLLYSGGGWSDNFYLTQYNLATGAEAEVQVEPDGGVMGLAVDQATGLVYLGTGRQNQPGGDNLRVYNASLNQIDSIADIPNSTGMVIPIKDVSYNPLNLAKSIIGGVPGEITPVGIGQTFTYDVSFDNNDNNYIVTNISIVDTLPPQVSFVTADGDGILGQYDAATHTYKWRCPSLLPGSSQRFQLVVRVNEDTAPDTIITNFVTIDSDQTPPTTRSVEAIAKEFRYSPLNLSKAIVGGVGEKPEPVFVGDTITYRICFDSNDNQYAVSNVSLIDTLPAEVSFVMADGNGVSGQYDAGSHTYTWSYPSLAPGSSGCLELVVRVNQGTAAGTIISDFVTIDSDQTPPTIKSVHAIAKAISYNPLNLSKDIVGAVVNGSPVEKIDCVNPGDTITYRICFDNNDNDYAVTNVSIVDILPAEMSFVTADGDGVSGHYDVNAHTYTWLYPVLLPKASTCLELVVQVNEGIAPDIMLTNSATISSDQTIPTTAHADVVTCAKPLQAELCVVPRVISSGSFGAASKILAIVALPAGVGKADIADTPLTLQPGTIEASALSVHDTGNRVKVLAFFDKARLIKAVSSYGKVKLSVVGKLKSGQSFVGEQFVSIAR